MHHTHPKQNDIHHHERTENGMTTPTATPASPTQAAPQEASEYDDLIPDEPLLPETDIGRASILLYGLPKIGKTTLASEFPDAVFIATEPGHKWITRTMIPRNEMVTNWITLGEVFAALRTKKAEARFKTVIIDTIDNLWTLCERWVVEEHNKNCDVSKRVITTADVGFGVLTKRVRNEFRRVMTALATMPYGLVMVSHAEAKEFETPNVGKWVRIVPTVHEQCRAIVGPIADIIVLFDVDQHVEDGVVGERRVLRCRQARSHDSGDRTIALPETIPLPNNPNGAYQILADEFEKGMAAKARGEVRKMPAMTPTGFEKVAKAKPPTKKD